MENMISEKLLASFLPSVFAKDEEMQTRPLRDLVLSDEWKLKVEKVRGETDPARRQCLKEKLPVFMPSGVFRSKCEEGLVRHNGYVCVDIDDKPCNVESDNFVHFKSFVASLPYVAYCGHSVGGRGYFCLIPIADPAKHTAHYRALEEEFKGYGITLDPACSNVCAKRFVSYDSEPYVNPDAQVYARVWSPVSRWNSVRTRMPVFSKDRTEKRFLEVLEQIKCHRVDITGGYRQWFKIIYSIASTFGERGRMYAHEVSRHYEGYSEAETNRQYDKCLRHQNQYNFTIATFFHYAKENGCLCEE